MSSTAVKSNALAELMNRASKIHWKNLSLTLNGHISETVQNFEKVEENKVQLFFDFKSGAKKSGHDAVSASVII